MTTIYKDLEGKNHTVTTKQFKNGILIYKDKEDSLASFKTEEEYHKGLKETLESNNYKIL